MIIFLMKISIFAKSLLLLAFLLTFSNCTTQKSTHIALPLPYMVQASDGLIYDASFHYKEFHASGLLVLKRIAPSNYHVVLLSKFGPAIMEFTLDKKGITWIKTFDRLDKPMIKKFIAKDFSLILLSVLENPKKTKLVKVADQTLTYKVKDNKRAKLKLDAETNRVINAENKGFINLFKTKVAFTYKENDLPQNIAITHNNINLRIDLNLLKVNHAER